MVTYTHSVTVEWGDCDPAGIVFYPNYYRWMDQATLYLFRSVGLGWDDLREKFDAPGLPLISTHAEYRAPSYFGDSLDVVCRVSDWGTKSLTVSHDIQKDGKTVVEGWEKRIWSKGDPAVEGRITPVPVPDEVKTLLGG